MTDSGIPEKSNTIEVTITVTRDEFAPTFTNTPYKAQAVPEDKEVGEKVFTVSGQDGDQKVGICELQHFWYDFLFFGKAHNGFFNACF